MCACWMQAMAVTIAVRLRLMVPTAVKAVEHSHKILWALHAYKLCQQSLGVHPLYMEKGNTSPLLLLKGLFFSCNAVINNPTWELQHITPQCGRGTAGSRR